MATLALLAAIFQASLAQLPVVAPDKPLDAKPELPVTPAAADDIVVTAHTGEHPARLGPPLPERPSDRIPRARLNLGNGAALTGDVSTHPREGVGEFHLTLRVPF